MNSRESLKEMSEVEISQINKDDLVDISRVSINIKDNPLIGLMHYIQEVKNPYLFKVGKIKVKIMYNNVASKKLEELLIHYFKSGVNSKY